MTVCYPFLRVHIVKENSRDQPLIGSLIVGALVLCFVFIVLIVFERKSMQHVLFLQSLLQVLRFNDKVGSLECLYGFVCGLLNEVKSSDLSSMTYVENFKTC